MHHMPAEDIAATFQRLPDPARGISLYAVTYRSQSLRVKAYLAVPEALAPAPPLVYCRGGIGRVGMVRAEQLVSFAARGYAVLAPFYRGAGSGVGRDEFGGDDRHDVYAAIRLVRSLPCALPAPVSLVGFSRGAMMAMLAARECDGVGAVALWGGVTDLALTYEERIDLRRMLRRVVGHPVKDAEAYRCRSAVHWAGDVRCPVLIVHGTDDASVSAEHARRLGRALAETGKPHAVSLYEGSGHHFPQEAKEAALDEIDGWLRRFAVPRE